MDVWDPNRMLQWTILLKADGRLKGVVLRLDLSMVATLPRLIIGGESSVLNV